MDRRGDMISLLTACCFTSITVILMLVSQVKGNLVVAPKNRTVAVGQSVQLDCSTDDIYSVNWEHFPLGSRTPRDVYISRTVVSPYSPRFSIRSTSERLIEKRSLGSSSTAYNLHITDIRMEDAGTYRCVDRTGMGEQRSAELTVVGSLPNCTSNIGPNGFICENDCHNPIDEIRASCSIEYAGNTAPEMQWKTTYGQDTIQPQPIPIISEKTVSSVLNIVATKSMNGASVSWFSTQLPQMKWTSAPIKILYAKRNLSPVILSQSGIVRCSANSSQDCSYTWFEKTDTDNKFKPVKRQTLEVNKPGIYLCEANCPFHHTPCTVIAMHVEYRNADERDYKTNVLITCLVIAALLAIVLGIGLSLALVVIRKQRTEPNRLPNSSPSPQNGSSSSQEPLINKSTGSCLRQYSNGTPCSSNSGSSPSGSDEKESCMNEKSNGLCISSVPHAYEEERQDDSCDIGRYYEKLAANCIQA